MLTPERANDLRQLPLQDCDVLLHEAGAPPIHTPLSVLMELPEPVKKRLYVVHTSALPDDCPLRVAPTGTAGTIRLDELHLTSHPQAVAPRHHGATNGSTGHAKNGMYAKQNGKNGEKSLTEIWEIASDVDSITSLEPPRVSTRITPRGLANSNVYGANTLADNVYYHGGSSSDIWDRNGHRRKSRFEPGRLPPLVFLRPTCVSDAWFILNLLSNVPFLSR